MKRVTAFLGRCVAAVLKAMIQVYRYVISPYLPMSCRYQPTCSSYALEAIGTHGVIKGGVLAMRRIARCHPWAESGVDPVPQLKREI